MTRNSEACLRWPSANFTAPAVPSGCRFLRIINRNIPFPAVAEFLFDLAGKVSGTHHDASGCPASAAAARAIQGRACSQPAPAVWVLTAARTASASPVPPTSRNAGVSCCAVSNRTGIFASVITLVTQVNLDSANITSPTFDVKASRPSIATSIPASARSYSPVSSPCPCESSACCRR